MTLIGAFDITGSPGGILRPSALPLSVANAKNQTVTTSCSQTSGGGLGDLAGRHH